MRKALRSCSWSSPAVPSSERCHRYSSKSRNRADLLVVHFACVRTGAIFVPLNWRLSAHEMAAILDHCEPRVILHDADLTPLLALAHLPVVSRTVWPVRASHRNRSSNE